MVELDLSFSYWSCRIAPPAARNIGRELKKHFKISKTEQILKSLLYFFLLCFMAVVKQENSSHYRQLRACNKDSPHFYHPHQNYLSWKHASKKELELAPQDELCYYSFHGVITKRWKMTSPTSWQCHQRTCMSYSEVQREFPAVKTPQSSRHPHPPDYRTPAWWGLEVVSGDRPVDPQLKQGHPQWGASITTFGWV